MVLRALNRKMEKNIEPHAASALVKRAARVVR